ncbi:MAG: hypothetical protein VKL59_16230 [Nostocaceae cyanobacterium]|nr:hypothetical protein [Nostocaceae cyanobacterium]
MITKPVGEQNIPRFNILVNVLIGAIASLLHFVQNLQINPGKNLLIARLVIYYWLLA